MTLFPRVIDNLLLIPRVRRWPHHGWRYEILIDDLGDGDIAIGEFVATRAEAEEDAMRVVGNWPSRGP